MLALFVVLATGFGVSLLPVLFPGALVGQPGAYVNHLLARLLIATFGSAPGVLVGLERGAIGLTLQGVLAVYLPPLILALLILRGR